MSESDISTEKSPLDHLANLAWAAGDRLRLGVLRVLARDAFGVLELCQLFDIKQPSMSHHLKILSEAGLVVHRREGTNLYYRRAPAPSALVAELFCALDAIATDTLTSQRLEAIQAARAEASRRFFAQFGTEYREHQDLIARLSDYGPRVVERTAAIARDAVVLEIGPGGGELLPELASFAHEVIAVDVSAEMLAQAKERARAQQVSNIRFVHSDTAHALALGLPPAQAIVMNMVLHHIAKPAEIFHHVAALLAPGGRFLLTELCDHSHGEKAREICGDVWPGFHPDTLTAWATDAGLIASHEEYQAQRNGFRLQLREFTQPLSQ